MGKFGGGIKKAYIVVNGRRYEVEKTDRPDVKPQPLTVFEQYREKQRVSREKGKKKIVVFDADTQEKIGVYDDVETVTVEFNISKDSVMKVLHQFKSESKGLHFEYYWSSLNKKWQKKAEEREIPKDLTPRRNKRKEKIAKAIYEKGK